MYFQRYAALIVRSAGCYRGKAGGLGVIHVEIGAGRESESASMALTMNRSCLAVALLAEPRLPLIMKSGINADDA